MRSNKGQMHLEIIISMMMFIGFVIAIIIIINPLENNTKDRYLTEIVKTNVIGQTSTTLLRTGIKINESTTCSRINFNPEGFVTARDSNDNKINARKYAGMTYLRNNGVGYYYVYSSEEFNDSTLSVLDPSCVQIKNYTLGSSQTIMAVSYKKITALKELYDNSYPESKERLGIPRGDDYGIIITNTEGTTIISMTKERTNTANTEATEANELMIKPDGSMEYVNIKVLTY